MSDHRPGAGEHLPPPSGDQPTRYGRSGRAGRTGTGVTSRTSRSGRGGGADRRATGSTPARTTPNYAMRRTITGVAAVVVLIVSVIVIARAFGEDDGRSSAGRVDADWNTAVVLAAGEIRLVDPATGDVIDVYPDSGDLLDDQSLVNGSMLVTMTDFGRITITDLTDGSVRRGQAGTDETMLRSRDHDDVVLIGPDVGGDLTAIDLSERSIISVGDIAGLTSPLMFATDARVNPAGTHLAVSDGRSFQTIVVDLAEAAAVPLAGQIVSINDRTVVTAQRAGASTELEFYDLAGERIGSVDLPTPVATMLTNDDSVVTVDATGVVREARANGVREAGTLTRPSADEESDGTPASPTGGVDAASRTRLLVDDGSDTWVLDDTGDTVLFNTSTSSSPVTGETRCVNIGGGFNTTSTIVDVDRGRIIGDLDGLVVSVASVDGCTAALLGRGTVVGDEPTIRFDGEPGSGTNVWFDGGLIEIVGDSVAAIAPDGEAAAVVDGTRTLLVDLGDGDAITLATEPVVVHFAER